MNTRSAALSIFLFLALTLFSTAQTFEVQGQPEQANASQKKSQEKKPQNKKNAGEAAEGIGWGSSIEVGRLSRAAELALAHGNPSQAADYAARAAQAAPQNNRLWFLLGYAARMAGRSRQSIEAYEHGLRNEPGSIEGLSGLAQTYMRTGDSEQAKKLLLQVIAANPHRPIDLEMAGELFVQSGDTERGAQLLQRSESMQPNEHTEIMLATAYLKLNQRQKAKELLERARARGGKNTDLFRAVANFYRESRDYDAAIRTLQEIAHKTPDVLAELGFTYMQQGDKQHAAEAYAKAAAQAPRDIKIQVSAAESQVRIGDFAAARRYLGAAEALDANYYRLHAIRADLARTENHSQDAIREYNLALANLPPDGVPEGTLYPIQLRMALAEQYRNAGNVQSARQQVEAAAAEIQRMDIQGPPRAEFLALRASVEAAGDDDASAEKDLQEARKIDPDNLNIVIQYAAFLWRNQRPEEARTLYSAALMRDPHNRFALEAMGYIARESGDNQTAEEFFKKLQSAYPGDYVAGVALGDLYTAERRYPEAQQNYEAAYKVAPQNPQVVAGGANAAIEAHQMELADKWLQRAREGMKDDPRVMRQEERYLFHKGKYLESAELGRKVLDQLPGDREGSVYLGYDLYNLGRYDETLAVARKYGQILPKEPNFPLLAGHAEKQAQLLAEAADDYTRAIEVDPGVDQAWINRGYVLNDMQNAEQAAKDFEHVLKTEPDNGVAHLGLSFSSLQLRQGKRALAEADAAQKLLGESASTHLARAGAFREMRALADAEKEYRAVLKFAPDDLTTELALADTEYNLHHYAESIGALKDALGVADKDTTAPIYGRMAHAYAHLRDRELTLRYVSAAEKQEPDSSTVLLDTGDALLTLGDDNAAMDRFAAALEAPDANRVDARLMIARLMAARGRDDDARQQISLAFAESRVGEASPVTTDNVVEAANILLSMHDFELAQKYFLKAREAGAADEVVAIGLANTYLAQGNALQAQAQLAALGNSSDLAGDYDYALAMANVYRERHDSRGALAEFARANMLAPLDDTAERGQEELAEQEGMQVLPNLSLASTLDVSPVFDDASIYQTYSRLSATPIAPLSLEETRWMDLFRVHPEGVPFPITGFFELRNAAGDYICPGPTCPAAGNGVRELPADTYDTIFNGGINPVLHLGSNYLAFNTGLQFTIRRDLASPAAVDQNLFRQFVYVQSSSIWNWISVRGDALHESGPFTDQPLSSRDLVGNIQFEVGRPWGRTSLLTGYHVRDLTFQGRPQQFFQTSAYVGLQRKFGRRLTTALLGEDVRSWAVLGQSTGRGQMLRPAIQADFQATPSWEVNSHFAWSRGEGDHLYDNSQAGFFVSYVRHVRRNLRDRAGVVPVDYPLRFSAGLEQQDFFNYGGDSNSQFRPVFRLSVF